MNRGINDSKDLPKEYLEDIYDQIKMKEITLKSTRSGAKTSNIKGMEEKSILETKVAQSS